MTFEGLGIYLASCQHIFSPPLGGCPLFIFFQTFPRKNSDPLRPPPPPPPAAPFLAIVCISLPNICQRAKIMLLLLQLLALLQLSSVQMLSNFFPKPLSTQIFQINSPTRKDATKSTIWGYFPSKHNLI